jgi:hypothetical protein
LPLGPTAKKRGWNPSSAEPSYPSTVQSSTSGYLDTPAKYRDMAETQSFGKDDYNSQDQGDEMEAGTLSFSLLSLGWSIVWMAIKEHLMPISTARVLF